MNDEHELEDFVEDPSEGESPEEFRERMQESSLSSVELVGELYYGEELVVKETSFGGNVALFNLIFFKKTKNGFKEHRLYIKTFSDEVIEWLKDQPRGLFIRISGLLESNGSKCYVNAKKIEPVDDGAARFRFDQIRREMQEAGEEPATQEDLEEATRNIRRIRFADRELAMARGGICEKDEGKDEGCGLHVELELGGKSMDPRDPKSLRDREVVRSLMDDLDLSYKREKQGQERERGRVERLKSERYVEDEDERGLEEAWERKRRSMLSGEPKSPMDFSPDRMSRMAEELEGTNRLSDHPGPECSPAGHQGWREREEAEQERERVREPFEPRRQLPADDPPSPPKKSRMFSGKKRSAWSQ